MESGRLWSIGFRNSCDIASVNTSFLLIICLFSYALKVLGSKPPRFYQQLRGLSIRGFVPALNGPADLHS